MALYVVCMHYLFKCVCFGRLLVEFGYPTTKSLPKHTDTKIGSSPYMSFYMRTNIKYPLTQLNLL